LGQLEKRRDASTDRQATTFSGTSFSIHAAKAADRLPSSSSTYLIRPPVTSSSAASGRVGRFDKAKHRRM